MSNRHDLYGPIHKGLRWATARMMMRLGSTDWRNAEAGAATLAALRRHLAIAREHLEHEDQVYHPALRATGADLAAILDHDHADHYATFDALAHAIAAVENAAPHVREAEAQALYLRFSTYAADDFEHMAREETLAQPAFAAHYDDAALQALEGRVIGSIAPDRLADYYDIMLPGMSPAQRATFVAYVGRVAPPEAFAQLRDEIARRALSPDEHRLLLDDLAAAA